MLNALIYIIKFLVESVRRFFKLQKFYVLLFTCLESKEGCIEITNKLFKYKMET